MIRKIADFMITPCETIDVLVGLQQVEELLFEKEQDCFPVTEDGQVIGILTSQDIARAHPNRIVADAMSGQFTYVEPDMSLWHARKILEQNNLAALLVREHGVLSGLVTPTIVKHEMGKHIDLLTGLHKTDYLYYQALNLMASGSEISIIFADIDNFGELNKQHGHIIGNLILKEFSVILQEHMPPEASLCRFGGDEFAILVPCSEEAIKVFAQELEQIVAGHIFGDNISVNISTGVATAAGMDQSFSANSRFLVSLINKASLASTSAKKNKYGIRTWEQMSSGESA